MKRILLLAVLSSLLFTSCRFIGKRVKGSGNVTTESRNYSNFYGVDISGAIDLYVKQDAAYGVKVVVDDNLQQYVQISEEGGILHIKTKRGYRLKPTSSIKVYASAPLFRSFDASGACDIYTENTITNNESVALELSGASDADMDIKSPKVDADLTGAGSVKLRGETRDFTLDGTGSSSFKCFNLLAENVDVDITGSGDAEVFASVKLNVKVTGSGSVKYKGSAAVSQRVSGAGSVNKVD
jgi:hypothetical protein